MRYIIANIDGPPATLTRIAPAYGGRQFVGLSDDEIIQRVINRNIEVGVIPNRDAHWVIDETDLPGGAVSAENDYFFRAWVCTDGVVSVDMSKARTIHLAEIRRVRDTELAKEDINLMIANESGPSSEQDAVKAKKQTLRDIPATFDITTGVDTPEELKAKWPTELPDRE